jgi:tetratricopeptide (TPR) repeat protein
LALTNIRDYVPAIAAFENARTIQEKYAKADPKDARAQYDLAIDLSNEALTYLDMLDPRLHADRSDDARTRKQGIALLKECRGIMGKLVAIDPNSMTWTVFHAYNGAVLGTLDRDAQLSAETIAELRKAASIADPAIGSMDLATSAMLMVQPVRLRDPTWNLVCAEKLVTRVHRKKAEFLLTLVQAYRAAGKPAEAQATAREALALLPAPRSGEPLSRNRVLLTIESSE